jgi:hypothetical protein
MCIPPFQSWNRWNKIKLFKKKILLELSIFSSSFRTISHLRYDEIWWIEMVFYKYIIVLNMLTISLFYNRLEGKRNHLVIYSTIVFFLSLMDHLVRLKPRWSSNNLLEKKKKNEWLCKIIKKFFWFLLKENDYSSPLHLSWITGTLKSIKNGI